MTNKEARHILNNMAKDIINSPPVIHNEKLKKLHDDYILALDMGINALLQEERPGKHQALSNKDKAKIELSASQAESGFDFCMEKVREAKDNIEKYKAEKDYWTKTAYDKFANPAHILKSKPKRDK